jgi:hypothetical protein
MDSGEFALTFLVGILSGVFIVVGGEKINKWLNRLKMDVAFGSSTFINTPTKVGMVLGVGIAILQGKELNGAYVKFNGKTYPWWENGKQSDKKQLLVGEDHSYIYPLYLELAFVEDISSETEVINIVKREELSSHGVRLTLTDYDTRTDTVGHILFSKCYGMPKDTVAFDTGINLLLSKVSVRLMGEGVETPMKSEGELKLKRLMIGKLEKGVPSMDTCLPTLVLYIL